MCNDVSGIPGENLSAEIILDLMDCFNRFCEKYNKSIHVKVNNNYYEKFIKLLKSLQSFVKLTFNIIKSYISIILV